MDTSETYIKMCDCPEIQKRKPYNDEYYFEFRGGICHHGDFVSYQEGSIDIWLPRQDQLQEMVDAWWREQGDFGKFLITKLHEFAMSFHPQPFQEDKMPLQSWEQLWLAFVMKEKHNKVWNGESWQ